MPDLVRTLLRFLSRPVTLYRFDRQHLSWCYAQCDRVIPVGGVDYLPARGLKRSTIRDGGNDKQSELKIHAPYLLNPNAEEFPVTQPLGDNWRPYAPGDEILVTVMETQFEDPEGELSVIWTGHVMQPEFTDTQLTLTCAPGRMATRKSGMIPRWCRGCWVPWGSQGRGMCNVDIEAHAAPAVLSHADLLTLRAPEFAAFPSGRLRGGFIRWERADGLLERRDIRSHEGDAIVVNYGAHDLAPELDVTVYPGCAHNEADCGGYFDNLVNYPGIKTLPTKDLFDGNRRIQ